MTRKRADQILVARGLFESRAKAQEAIAAGLVRANGAVVARPSVMLGPDAAIEAEAPYPWVSRGGVKLAAALDHFAIDPTDGICLDLGASTGGFSDVLLARGALRVHAVDVGHGQLHPRLAGDPRLLLHEGCDARAVTPHLIGAPVDLVVIDVSFISLRLVLPAIGPLVKPTAQLIALVKPQFEAGRAHVRKGLVRDETIRQAVCRDIAEAVAQIGFRPYGIVPSPIVGGDGNVEYLLGAGHHSRSA